MKKLLIVATALSVYTAAQSQVPQTQRYELNLLQRDGQPFENTIQVNGTADREVTPDEIYVRIVISENDTKGKTTVDQMEQDMIGALRSAGVDVENDLKVGDMSAELYERAFGRRSGRTTATYEVKVSDAVMLGRVYQNLSNAGIYNLGISRVGHSRITQINDELRVEAVKNARTTAQSMAWALGQDIGKAVYILDFNQQPLYARSAVMAEYAVADMATGSAPVQLDFRNIKLNYSVTVKFVLE